jgi:hypothetical protein
MIRKVNEEDKSMKIRKNKRELNNTVKSDKD